MDGFADRLDAGRLLGQRLAALALVNPVVLALPRGGVPVAPPDTVAQLRGEVDDLVCLFEPPYFHAVGVHYGDFHQIEDDEVIALLDAAAVRR